MTTNYLSIEELEICMVNDDYVYDGHILYKIEEIKRTKKGTRLILKATSLERHADYVGSNLTKPSFDEVAEIQRLEAIKLNQLRAELEEKRKKEEAEKAAIEAEKKRLEELAKKERQDRIQHLLDAAIKIDREDIDSMNLQRIAIPDPYAQWADDPPLYGYILAVVDGNEVVFAEYSKSSFYGLHLRCLSDEFMDSIELIDPPKETK